MTAYALLSEGVRLESSGDTAGALAKVCGCDGEISRGRLKTPVQHPQSQR